MDKPLPVAKKPTKREILAAIEALREQTRTVLRMVSDRFPSGSKIGECRVVGVPYQHASHVFLKVEYPVESDLSGFDAWDVEAVLRRKKNG